MTDSDIIKALDCCTGLGCDKCKFNDGEPNTCSCEWELKNAAMEVLKRQQAEIERLKEEITELTAAVDKQYEQARADILGNMADGGASCHWCIAEHKKNAVKDFVGRLEDRLPPLDSDYCVHEYRQVLFYIDRIVEEMEYENCRA